jgi:FkbM family methyltransferase
MVDKYWLSQMAESEMSKMALQAGSFFHPVSFVRGYPPQRTARIGRGSLDQVWFERIFERMLYIKKHWLFWLVLGRKTSLRFTIAREIYYSIKFPGRTIKKLLRQLAGRKAYIRVGKNIMEVPEDMFAYFLDGDYYEKNVSYWIEKILLSTKNKVFYDIGANYGYYCLKLSTYANRIYAFEPASTTNDFLIKNVSINDIVNVKVYKLAIGDKEENVKINLYSCSGNNSLFLRNIPKDHPTKLVGQETVGLVSLDALIHNEGLNPPDLIKVDIEGAELYALRGARETIKKYQPALVIEYLEPTFKDAGYSKRDLLAELKANKYVIYGIPKDVRDLNVYPLDKFDDIEIENIIALPTDMEGLIEMYNVPQKLALPDF